MPTVVILPIPLFCFCDINFSLAILTKENLICIYFQDTVNENGVFLYRYDVE